MKLWLLLIKYIFNIVDLKKALEYNQMLSELEEEFILSLFPMIEENKEYIDMFKLEQRLRYLTIQYEEDLDQYCIKNNSVAYCNLLKKRVFLGYASSIKNVLEDSTLKASFTHELIHIFSKSLPLFGKSILEATVETLTYEYKENELTFNNPFYYHEKVCLYALLEIIGVDSIKTLCFRGNPIRVLLELSHIIPSKIEAFSFIRKMDSLIFYEKELLTSDLKEEEYQKERKKYKDAKKAIYKKLKNYFETKYGYSMEQDETMMLYLVYSGFLDSHELNGEKVIATNIIPKGYFSKSYIKNHPNLVYDAKVQFDFYKDTYPKAPMSVDFNQLYRSHINIDDFSNYQEIYISQIEVKSYQKRR